MRKYMCWLYNETLKGWVLSPQNVIESPKTLEEIQNHFLVLYPNRAIRIEYQTIEPIMTQLSLF